MLSRDDLLIPGTLKASWLVALLADHVVVRMRMMRMMRMHRMVLMSAVYGAVRLSDGR